jgi:hypothetical protein
MNDFQQGAAFHFNDSCFHRVIVVSISEGARQVAPAQQAASSTILKLIDTLVSEGAQRVSLIQRFVSSTIYSKSFELIDVSVPNKNEMCNASQLATN